MSANPNRRVFQLDVQPHSAEEIELLYHLYLERRIENQLAFYDSRIKENDLNSGFTFVAGTFIMTLSALLATISATASVPILALVSAILPAFSALLAAFRQLYGWDRQANLYRDALVGLEKVKLLTPDDDRLAVTDIRPLVPRIIGTGELVFNAEVSQWGQVVLATEEESRENKPQEDLNKLVQSLDLSAEQQVKAQELIAGGAPVYLRSDEPSPDEPRPSGGKPTPTA